MSRLALVTLVAGCQLLASTARADLGDFQIYTLGNPDSVPTANASFRLFANQLAAAISSFDGAPPETLGHSGFNIAFEYQVAQIDSSAGRWPTSGADRRYLLMPTLHVRKGLGLSFEVGTRLSYLQSSHMAAATVELKWALNEGFSFLPDLGIRGYGTRLIGSRDFSLTTAGLDVGIGHQFGIGGVLTLTPYAGWNLQFVSAISDVVDFNPGRTAGAAVTDPMKETNVFASVDMKNNLNNRVYLGLRLITYVFELAVEGSVVFRRVDSTGTVITPQVYVFGGKIGIDF